MSEPSTADDLTAHLRDAVDGGSRWVLLTDDPAAARLLAGFRAVLLFDGHPPRAAVFAQARLFVAPDARAVDLAVLTADKAAAPRRLVAELVGGLGGRLAPDQDLVMVGDDPEYLAGCLDLLVRGRCFAPPAPDAN